jgi:uncharacterized protein YjbI with pentapeptide repeats
MPMTKAELEAKVKEGANLRGANLRGANLQGADLRGADLQGADLWGADLWGANLRGADLWGADLQGANLRGADLQGANLRGAYLQGANLRGANLRGAYLSDKTILTTGEMFADYNATVVPALLTSGGKPLGDAAAVWQCHDWSNCPLHAAFGVEGTHQIPLLLRPRAEQFLQLFDAHILPVPVTQ